MSKKFWESHLPGSYFGLVEGKAFEPGSEYHGYQCSQAASPARFWVGLGRPRFLLKPAEPDCGPQFGS